MSPYERIIVYVDLTVLCGLSLKVMNGKKRRRRRAYFIARCCRICICVLCIWILENFNPAGFPCLLYDSSNKSNLSKEVRMYSKVATCKKVSFIFLLASSKKIKRRITTSIERNHHRILIHSRSRR